MFSASFFFGAHSALLGSTVAVRVLDDFFSPQAVTNFAGDTVEWSWQGSNSHSSTGDGISPLWDSGIHGNGFSFSHQFPAAGTFPYRCLVHSFQTGTITVMPLVANPPPSVAILSPTNGATFAAPWSGLLLGTVSDSGGSVTNIDFFSGSLLLGALANPSATFTWTLPELSAGVYNFKAVATDNHGATNTSAIITVSVVAATAISLSEPLRVSDSQFQFSFAANPGSTYVVSRSTSPFVWQPIATNTASGPSIVFRDDTATNSSNFYAVSLLRNP
jgi:plastocyanin